MAFLLNCPACGKEYNLPDTQQGKRVRCKDCAHTFVAEPKAADDEPTIKGISGSRTSGAERTGTSRSSRRDPDDEGEAAAPKKKNRKPTRSSDDSSGNLVIWLVVIGGGLFGLAGIGCCIAPIVMGIFEAKQLIDDMAPQSTDQALANLRSDNPMAKDGGLRYFADTGPVEENRRAEVAQALEGMLSDPDPNHRTMAVRGLTKWGSPSNAPALLRLVQEGNQELPSDAQKIAMETLGKWQYTPAIPVLLKQLSNHHATRHAEEGLKKMGPAAEPGVLTAMNDPNWDTAQRARNILEREFATSQDKLAAQCALDLKTGEHDRQKHAARWLADHPPASKNPQLRKDVALALDPLPGHANPQINENAINALKHWATVDNLNRLTVLAEDERPGQNRTRDWAIETMGRLNDPRAAVPLAVLLTRDKTRPQAGNALRQLGAQAEPEVRKLLKDPDKAVKIEACRVLRNIGTKASLPDLDPLAKDMSDRQVASSAAQAVKAINDRGK